MTATAMSLYVGLMCRTLLLIKFVEYSYYAFKFLFVLELDAYFATSLCRTCELYRGLEKVGKVLLELVEFGILSFVTVLGLHSVAVVTTPVFGVILTKIMLPDEESKVNIANLIVSLLLVALGVFMLNYVSRAKLPDEKIEEDTI